MEAMKIYEKVKSLQQDKGFSNRQLCALAGVSHSVLDNWKKRQVVPSLPILEDLCSVLGISVCQLLIGEQYERDLAEDEKRLLELWTTLDSNDKKIIFELMKNMRGKKGA